VPPIFLSEEGQKNRLPRVPLRGAGAALILANPDDREVLFSTGERFQLKEDYPMTAAHRILNNSGERRIESGGQVFAEDELCEALWLVNVELRAGLPRRERIEARRQIARYEALLSALRSAGV